jgi:hypothetical protein
VRLFGTYVAIAVLSAACAHGGTPASAPSSSLAPPSIRVNPVNIERVRGDLPGGYEVADIRGAGAPLAFWGFSPDWVADPPQCGALAIPVANGATTKGWSGSGPGGIVYAVVTGTPPAQVNLDPVVIAECGQWTLAAGHSTGTVSLVAAPQIDGAATVGMATATTTTVEGGTETSSQARTYSAYLGDYVAFVTVVTDPGSPNPPLSQDFAAALLVKTVAALRG